MKIKPLNGRVLIKPDDGEKTTSSGIIIASTTEKPTTGIVVGSASKLVKDGQQVVFSRFGYDEVSLEGVRHYLVSDKSIIGVYE